MKIFSIVGTLSILGLSLLLSVLLTILITPDDAKIIAKSLTIAKEQGWINHPESASRLSEEYHARKHAGGTIEAKPISVFLITYFGCCVLLACCHRGIKECQKIRQQVTKQT